MDTPGNAMTDHDNATELIPEVSSLPTQAPHSARAAVLTHGATVKSPNLQSVASQAHVPSPRHLLLGSADRGHSFMRLLPVENMYATASESESARRKRISCHSWDPSKCPDPSFPETAEKRRQYVSFLTAALLETRREICKDNEKLRSKYEKHVKNDTTSIHQGAWTLFQEIERYHQHGGPISHSISAREPTYRGNFAGHVKRLCEIFMEFKTLCFRTIQYSNNLASTVDDPEHHYQRVGKNLTGNRNRGKKSRAKDQELESLRARNKRRRTEEDEAQEHLSSLQATGETSLPSSPVGNAIHKSKMAKRQHEGDSNDGSISNNLRNATTSRLDRLTAELAYQQDIPEQHCELGNTVPSEIMTAHAPSSLLPSSSLMPHSQHSEFIAGGSSGYTSRHRQQNSANTAYCKYPSNVSPLQGQIAPIQQPLAVFNQSHRYNQPGFQQQLGTEFQPSHLYLDRNFYPRIVGANEVVTPFGNNTIAGGSQTFNSRTE